MRQQHQLGFGLVVARGKACGSKGQNTSQQGTNQYRGEMGGQQAEQFHGGHFAPAARDAGAAGKVLTSKTGREQGKIPVKTAYIKCNTRPAQNSIEKTVFQAILGDFWANC